MAPRPIVAITAGLAVTNGVARTRVNVAYVEALRAAGAIPVLLPVLPADAAADALAIAAGLVLTGGEDVDPSRYGRARHPATEPPDHARDAWECALVAAARARAVPTLAICRGLQLLNVVLGGTLVQDLASERPGRIDHAQAVRRADRVHEVSIDHGSRLHAAIGRPEIGVNSLHHQAPDDPAPGLHVVARAPDGVIEGMEISSDDWWAVGVQWHPEELHADAEPWDARLFRAFVEVAALSSRVSSAPRPAPAA